MVAGLLAGQPATAAEFYVHPDGNDSHPGELEQPFATVTRAQEAVSPVDTVWAAQTGSGFKSFNQHRVRAARAPRPAGSARITILD